MPPFALVAAASGALVLTIGFLLSRSRSPPHPFPPGPKPLPLVGNLLDMTTSMDWTTFSKWTDRYGGVVYLNVLGRPIILLNSIKANVDLLEKRASKYSDRPQFPLINLAGHQWNFGFQPYGKEWQSRRRVFTSQYNSMATLRSFYDAHRSAISNFLLNVLREPQDISNHLRLRSAQAIFDVTYGISVKSFDDRLVSTAEAVMDVVSLALNPGMWILNPIPIFNLLPGWLGGATISAKIQRCQSDLEDLRNVPFDIVKKSMAVGTAKPCFTTNLLRESGPVSEELIRDTAAIAMGAAYETTFSAGEVFLLAMTMHEDIQRSAQNEIDSVIGSDRLPDFIDRERLPFVTAIMKEVLRWHPPAPIGIPHELLEDDIYEGMLIPSGSIVMVNIWQVLHDSEMYPGPFNFDPYRFIQEGKLDVSKNDPGRFTFGFGRRSCPGRLFAEDSLWLMIAQFLAVYAISPLPEGPPPRAEFTMGGISQPLPFGRVVRVRSDAARKLLAELQED
ncbi:cytochrome P450 [Mycena rosella]|uniref:Cytochrome P450 n=1 Tax=Mycena rosella TaxID=1033263 RepID=A0AAD7G6N8_MYCRO|nr:cytochrome P450 [Mycena rosella]